MGDPADVVSLGNAEGERGDAVGHASGGAACFPLWRGGGKLQALGGEGFLPGGGT